MCRSPALIAEDSARSHAEGFVDAAHKLVGMIDKLYAGVEMPRQADGRLLWAALCAAAGHLLGGMRGQRGG